MKSKYNAYKNTGWTIERIWLLIVEENPCLSYEESYNQAKLTFNELNKMNNQMHNNTKKYFSNNLPFSYFEEDEDFLEYTGKT